MSMPTEPVPPIRELPDEIEAEGMGEYSTTEPTTDPITLAINRLCAAIYTWATRLDDDEGGPELAEATSARAALNESIRAALDDQDEELRERCERLEARLAECESGIIEP